MKKELVIMKLGGSLVTYKNRWMPTINEDNLKRFAKEIAEAYHMKKEKLNLILLHGAGSYGHVLATLYNALKENEYERKLLGFAEIQRLQNEFNSIVCAYLQNHNLPAFPVQASASAILENEKLVHLDIEAIKGLLSMEAIPVLYGVPAYDKIKGGGILSGDEIIRYLAEKLKPKRIIHVTDVDGIFDKDPKKHKNAKLIKKITRKNIKKIEKSLSGSTHFDVSGGMWRKVKELFELKNIEAEIINGLKEGYVKKALLGKKGLGTLIKT